jgi:murein L,D-transpeptidase YafK
VRHKFTLCSLPPVRALLASTVLAVALALAGCNPGYTPTDSSRHMRPLSPRMLAELDAKNMEKESPILVRIFKEEAELEVWKQDKTRQFALLRTYPICRWSGQLGPKIKQGDRQAPEGFYTITPSLMNPNSNYYLAINTGFPNAYDRANGRTGAFLMIHGDCSSSGCYAMTDEQIAEIYALARESFFGGQKSFQVEAFPFRMTPLNMARHRNSPHMAFWKMLKQGYDHFEVTHREPKVDVCEKRYVFDAESVAQFSPTERCPSYNVAEDIAAAVRDKQRRDDSQTAELISRGIPPVAVTMGVDGGMNPIFLAAVKSRGLGTTIRTSWGTIPAHVNPPAEPVEAATASFLSFASTTTTPRLSVQVASSGTSGFLANLLESTSADQVPVAPMEASAPKTKPAISKPAYPAVMAADTVRPKSEPQPGHTGPARVFVSKPPDALPNPPASAEAQSAPERTATVLLGGAAPIIPAGSFDYRFISRRQARRTDD